MIKDAILHIQNTAIKPEVHEIDGIKRIILPATAECKVIRPESPTPIKVRTLGGIVQYLRASSAADELWPDANEEDQAYKNYMIHIEGHDAVRVISPLEPLHMMRREYIHAVCRPNQFQFDRFQTTERFIISVMASFASTANRAALLDFVSQVKGVQSREQVDNSVNQEVTVKKSVVTVSVENVPNPVELQPYMTFPEITQPLQQYVFRIKHERPEDPIQCALFKIDSSVWETQTCENIREYFAEQCELHQIGAVIIS